MSAVPASPRPEPDAAARGFIPPPPSAHASASWDGRRLATINLRAPQREQGRGPRLRLIGRTAPRQSAADLAGGGHPFEAELSVSEMDERDRPGPVWHARGRSISRSVLVMTTRRLCYDARRLLVAVHLIDDAPVPLFGSVSSCDYEGDGVYRVEVALAPLPEMRAIQSWITLLRP